MCTSILNGYVSCRPGTASPLLDAVAAAAKGGRGGGEILEPGLENEEGGGSREMRTAAFALKLFRLVDADSSNFLRQSRKIERYSNIELG